MGAAATKNCPRASIPSPLAFGQPVLSSKIDVHENISRDPGKPCKISEDEHVYGMTELVGWRKHQGMTSFRDLHAEPDPERNSIESFQVYYAAIFRLRYSEGCLEQGAVNIASIVGSDSESARPVSALQLPDSKSNQTHELSSLQVNFDQSQHPTVDSNNGARSVLEAALNTTPTQQQTRCGR